MLASRAIFHPPDLLFRIDRVLPARLTGAPPFFGVMVTVRRVHIQAQSPRISISSISLLAWMSNDLSEA